MGRQWPRKIAKFEPRKAKTIIECITAWFLILPSYCGKNGGCVYTYFGFRFGLSLADQQPNHLVDPLGLVFLRTLAKLLPTPEKGTGVALTHSFVSCRIDQDQPQLA